MADLNLDRLVDDLDAHLGEVIDALPLFEEGGALVLRVPDLDAIIRRFVAVRLGEVS